MRCLVLFLFLTLVAGAQEWRCFGQDPEATHYSALTEINRQNVYGLEQAWEHHTGELDRYQGTTAYEKAAFECTPLMVDGRLYVVTPTCRVQALDPVKGRLLWSYDPQVDLKANFSELTSRGLAYGDGLVFLGTVDARLIALDARTGQLAWSADLREGMDAHAPGQYQVTSAPALVGEVVVVGSAIGDNRAVLVERGTVRGYAAATGKLLWSWDPEPGVRAGNAWAPLASDPGLGLVYVPTSSPAPDFYGALRPGDNRHASSLVALEARTGKLVWSFQTVHHDLWDYDNAAGPTLVTLHRQGKRLPAVVQATKMGHLFVLDRATGEPLFPVEEREVPASDIEQAWPTQPVSPDLPLLGLHDVQPWGMTREKEDFARDWIGRLRFDGTFTPPSEQGSIVAPSNVGGSNWSGMSYDPVRGLLLLNVNRVANVITLIPRDSVVEAGTGERLGIEYGRMEGTPYVARREYLFDIDNGKLPYTRPPWGTLAAVDLSNGKLRWEVPLGWMLPPGDFPMAANWGSLNLGGTLVTAGGLVFVGASMDGNLRAFNTDDGKLLWQRALPAGGQAAPMTYFADGHQYVVICAGGHAKLGSKLGDSVVAYRLK